MPIDVIHTPETFISEVLISEIKLITKTNPYLSLILIFAAIEFLGTCLDSESNWDTKDMSRIHFNLAINTLMPQYKNYNLYTNLRCGFAHRLAPTNNIGISTDDSQHLQIASNKLVIISVNKLFDDFEQATIKIISKITHHDFMEGDKINKPYLFSF